MTFLKYCPLVTVDGRAYCLDRDGCDISEITCKDKYASPPKDAYPDLVVNRTVKTCGEYMEEFKRAREAEK